ncbi:hypothetical protein [Listeria monocytogenes]|uniref:hypothetical protein n=1 Tax=Listeria monocytogenes TaxID=1639 RepID=UPI0011EB5DD9|nr:hypothetical protein [Listeria monocytogenes]TYV52921.1 hypothetical protein FZ058_12045 [Listeria monocytogenes]
MRLEKTTKAICGNLEPVRAGALDSLVNNFTFGSVETIGKNKEVYGDDNRYYVGRLIADSAGIYLGVEGIVLGVGTEILGGALDLTGAGAPIGIQLNVAGIGIITGSATVVVNSGANFFQDAKDLSSNIEKGKDKAKSDKSTKEAEGAGGPKTTVRDNLLGKVENPKLENAINEIYRPGATTGDGGLADAVRHELKTGELVGGKSHIQKATERVTNLENIINKQNLNSDDLKIAKDLLKDLKDALGGN